MMIQLESEEMKNAKCLIHINSTIYFACILKGEDQGYVWADDREKPTFLLVYSPYQESFQVMGQPLRKDKWNEFRQWFDTSLVSFIKEHDMDFFEYGVDSKELGEMFDRIFADQELESEQQKLFYWSKFVREIKAPEGYEVKRVDKDFLSAGYDNLSYITDEIIGAYGDIERYFGHGIVYAAIKENEIAGRADMLFCDSGYGNISVNTKKEHRRKGLSAYLAMRTIEDTCKLGIKPIWDCSEDNLASEKTALKCGFYQIREDKISWFHLK